MAEMIHLRELVEGKKAAYSDFLQKNAIALHSNIRRAEMLIGPSWNKRPDEVIDASIQLSGLMLLEAMALLEY